MDINLTNVAGKANKYSKSDQTYFTEGTAFN